MSIKSRLAKLERRKKRKSGDSRVTFTLDDPTDPNFVIHGYGSPDERRMTQAEYKALIEQAEKAGDGTIIFHVERDDRTTPAPVE